MQPNEGVRTGDPLHAMSSGAASFLDTHSSYAKNSSKRLFQFRDLRLVYEAIRGDSTFTFPGTAQGFTLFTEALEKRPGDQTQMGIWNGSSEAGKKV